MKSHNSLRVTKRNGELEDISFDKVLNRIKSLCDNLEVDYVSLSQSVIAQIHDGIKTSQLDELAAQQCDSLSTNHPDYSELASRIIISNNHKNTIGNFYEVMKNLHQFKDIHGNNKPLISTELMEFVTKYAKELEDMIDYQRDYLFSYFGFKTLENAYLFKVNKVVIERIQHMWMRVSVAIHFKLNKCNSDDKEQKSLELIKESYDMMSQKCFTHATPTLYNAGTTKSQLSSCYLVAMEEDSLDGIYNTLKECALISKYAGGIGLHIHNIRATGTHIQGTNGTSNGIVPMLRVFNNTARYCDQGGGKRKGSFAIYMEPWHADIESFLDMKKPTIKEEMRATDLFYALWISDLFMERVEVNGKWSLFCPHECPGLHDCYGDEFTQLYKKYENEGRARKTIEARDLWFKILDSQMETGTPYLLFKDSVNRKCNQKNLGTIRSSNLCTEITEYSDEKETAVCNLASIALPAFVNETTKEFDYEKLHQVAKVVTNNLNEVIDINYYPTPKTKRSNLRHRPIGIGVQGLADTFIMMDIPFHSEMAKTVNKLIFETIYHASLEKSNEIAKERRDTLISLKSRIDRREFLNEYENTAFNWDNFTDITPNDYCGAYSSFCGSPASQGILQFDMWNVSPTENRYDWDTLKESIKKYGLRNSLLVAPMPTASTSQILGYNECFEPLTSNLYNRGTLAGNFYVVNKYLMRELIQLNLWSNEIKQSIIANKGSIQHLTQVPDHIRNKYKTVWEIPMKHIIDMAADRGAFICQSQSMNLWMEDPNYAKLTSMHFYSWRKGLKTGIYYLRRKAKHQAQQFTVDPNLVEKTTEKKNDEEVCEMCSA